MTVPPWPDGTNPSAEWVLERLTTLGHTYRPISGPHLAAWRSTCPACGAILTVTDAIGGLRLWCAAWCPRDRILAHLQPPQQQLDVDGGAR